MKKYIKTFGDRPEEVMVLRTKVFFDQDGIAEVDDEVADVLEEIPGYDFVAEIDDEGKDEGEDDKTPVEPPSEPDAEPSNDEGEEEAESEDVTSEEEDSDEDKPAKVPSRRKPAPGRR